MPSKHTATFLADARAATHHGLHATHNDPAGFKSFFGHLKGEHPHLNKITDSGRLETKLDRLRSFYNGIRPTRVRDT